MLRPETAQAFTFYHMQFQPSLHGVAVGLGRDVLCRALPLEWPSALGLPTYHTPAFLVAFRLSHFRAPTSSTQPGYPALSPQSDSVQGAAG